MSCKERCLSGTQLTYLNGLTKSGVGDNGLHGEFIRTVLSDLQKDLQVLPWHFFYSQKESDSLQIINLEVLTSSSCDQT